MLICNQSGSCGTAPARPIGDALDERETVRSMNNACPHWLCRNFKRFNEAPENLSFDQHALIALCAPRSVLVSNAAADLFANPTGTFQMALAADPVYRLLCGEGLDAKTIPALDEQLMSRLSYFIRPGRHAMTVHDWNAWLDYADSWL
jgi:hypothetical protein